MEINNAAAVAQLTALHEVYEQALIENDVPILEAMFWDSPHAVRYGTTENLYGIDEIKAFRRARLPVDIARQVERVEITTFGDSLGVINLHFTRVIEAVTRQGRQTQMWVKIDDEWKIVSGHVSFLLDTGSHQARLNQAGSYIDAAAEKIGLPIRPEDRRAVEEEMKRISSIAQVMLQFPLEQSIESAPSFQP